MMKIDFNVATIFNLSAAVLTIFTMKSVISDKMHTNSNYLLNISPTLFFPPHHLLEVFIKDLKSEDEKTAKSNLLITNII